MKHKGEGWRERKMEGKRDEMEGRWRRKGKSRERD